MCGIVGAIARRDVGEILLEGLKRLEYRGYDSAGLAIMDDQQRLRRLRTVGKVKTLCDSFHTAPLKGKLGIAHTRWATHGKVTEQNAHPHQSGEEVSIVHNGIIENYEALREQLEMSGYQFETQTDSEVVAHLLRKELSKNLDLIQTIRNMFKQLNGAFALGILLKNEPDRLIAVRYSSPLVIGLGVGENFIASDNLALLPVSQKFIFLKDGDVADVHSNNVVIYDGTGKIVEREIYVSDINQEVVDKKEYRHFMAKEIFEQRCVLQETLENRVSQQRVLPECFGEKANELFSKVRRIQITACGTSYHAGMVSKYWLEEIAGIPCQVEVASEFRYRKTVISKGTLFIAVSQSGETADVLAALRQAKSCGYLGTLAICNVPESSLVRESDLVFLTKAGREIGVASTKAFTTQLTALLMLTVVLARHHFSDQKQAEIAQLFRSMPQKISEVLQLNRPIEQLASLFANKQHALFLARGIHYPIAMEGALKLKELSYIHAEAYPAGELKHGPLALVDKEMPVVAVAPNDSVLEKLKSNLKEVQARGGQLIVFGDQASGIQSDIDVIHIEVPKVDALISPIIYTVPLQLLAYHVALIKGTDVDQPRNLAKSVTVE
jgi:glucosamine--fructose-6-phosphate aminotransferase (isomerizing)